MSMADTPRGSRLHIGLFGRRNSGKSSLLNALTGQQVALVSETAGTTTDPVYKAMELPGIGPVVFIDTAGFDDVGSLGEKRVEKTREAQKATDIALVLFSQVDMEEELAWVQAFRQRGTAVIPVVSRSDCQPDSDLPARVEQAVGQPPVIVSAVTGQGLEALRAELIRCLPEDYEVESITGGLCGAGDIVLLVMPQDIQAPKGRLILPQVQTLRELLDKKCRAMCCTADGVEEALEALAHPPKLIITDSQVFPLVYGKKPKESLLTSFSVLFARVKGDMAYFTASAPLLLKLLPTARILIAEACTHQPVAEDIGRVKLPRLLRKRLGGEIFIDVVGGRDFPADLSGYDFIIHCGACMFNRRYVLSRTVQAKAQGIPMTNYGIAIACLNGILDQVVYPMD